MSSQTYTTGPGLCTLLTVAFVVLKLTGQITWPWIWVLAPAWISFALAVFIIAIVLIVALVASKKEENDFYRNLKRRRNL